MMGFLPYRVVVRGLKEILFANCPTHREILETDLIYWREKLQIFSSEVSSQTHHSTYFPPRRFCFSTALSNMLRLLPQSKTCSCLLCGREDWARREQSQGEVPDRPQALCPLLLPQTPQSTNPPTHPSYLKPPFTDCYGGTRLISSTSYVPSSVVLTILRAKTIRAYKNRYLCPWHWYFSKFFKCVTRVKNTGGTQY